MKSIAGVPIDRILANPRLKEWGIEFSDVSGLPANQAYTRILCRYADKLGKSIVGEKTPHNEFYLGLLDQWLEGHELRFIHMVRNPLDVIASYKKLPYYRGKLGESVSMVASVASDWNRSAAIGLARQHSKSARHLVVKYEDLTGDPAAITQNICRFIGVPLEEERMLAFEDFHDSGDNTSYPGREKVGQQGRVFQSNTRKDDLSSAEIKQVSAVCGELAWALGYRDTEFSLKPQAGPPKLGWRLTMLDWLKRIGVSGWFSRLVIASLCCRFTIHHHHA